ncbi:unnamed protein product [Lactuca saligna]|uniref:Uncharacterized protein n=1 Tax=Lactuca saligna TaxID=75948 RepID=A0AA36E3T9_LACSI|nr:unnamed protein product [Lactuca saligna]
MRDVVITDIPKIQTTTFVTIDPKNFLIVGSLSKAMLSWVPTDHPIIVKYFTTLSKGDVGLNSINEEEIAKNKVKSSKQKGKMIMSKKSTKKNRKKLTQLVIEDDLSEHTLDRTKKDSTIDNEEDSANIGLK